VKQKKSEFISFRTTEDVKNMLDELGEINDRPLSDVIHQLLRYFVKNPPKQLPIPDKK